MGYSKGKGMEIKMQVVLSYEYVIFFQLYGSFIKVGGRCCSYDFPAFFKLFVYLTLQGVLLKSAEDMLKLMVEVLHGQSK